MNQCNDLIIKCPNPEQSNNVKLICFDESCKADRLYCIQCSRNGIHLSNPQHQLQLPNLFDHIDKIHKECEDLINRLIKYMDFVYQSFYQLVGGIKQNINQVKNKSLIQIPNKSILQTCNRNINSKNVFLNFKIKLYQELNLTQLNYYLIPDLDIKKSEELYQKGYKLYWYDHKYQEAIKTLDQALSLNSKHQLALWCKAERLKMLDQFNEAIILADKSLQINLNILIPCKLKKVQLKMYEIQFIWMLDLYNEAIIWVELYRLIQKIVSFVFSILTSSLISDRSMFGLIKPYKQIKNITIHQQLKLII